jgi:hypothetical protein
VRAFVGTGLKLTPAFSPPIQNLQRIETHAISGINGKYVWSETASSVDVYVIDTYVLVQHLQAR